MSKIEDAFYNLGFLEQLSHRDTPIHTIDPRAKLITTLLFIALLMSFDKYEISALLIFSLYPVVTASLGEIPFKYLAKNLLITAPFALFIGIFNPIFDQKILLYISGTGITGGWISFLSIMIRFILTVSSAFILIATTGFFSICIALERLKVPQVFVVQLMFLYRYIHVLIIESIGLVRARALRSFDGRGMGIRAAGSIIGQLLLRTINRARRIHLAMLSRSFDGEIRINRKMHFNLRSLLYMLFWCVLLAGMRFFNLPVLLGNFIEKIIAAV